MSRVEVGRPSGADGSARAPTSTYRLQLGEGLRFADVTPRMAHYRALGVGCLYLSPITTARPGSSHGYDVTDPTRLDPRLGTHDEFRAFAAAARAHDIGIVIDIVPNHMAASVDNRWWVDVLRHGRASAHARFFDIDWAPPWPDADDRVLLPMLGERYGEALRGGRLTVAFEAPHGFVLCYYEHRVPLDPATGADVLAAGEADGIGAEVAPVIAALRALPRRAAEHAGARAAAADAALAPLWTIAETAAGRAWIDAAAARLHPDAAGGLERLDALLSAQPWRLAYWKVAAREANYRRFFDINELVGVCVEDPEVREATHALVIELWRARLIDGVRVDHVDGLADPGAYLAWLRGALGPDAWIIVEKILERGEALPAWPVDGTTGYDFLAAATALFVEPAALPSLEETYAAFTGRDRDYEDLALDKQRAIIDLAFRADIRRLAARLARLARRDLDARDVAESELGRVLTELTTALPVYRTYIDADGRLDDASAASLDAAFTAARARDPVTDEVAYAFVSRVLRLDVAPTLVDEARAFIGRWQQLTPPVRAKGIEDTSLYVYNRLLALNDVGTEPSADDMSLARWHQFAAERRARWPDAMNATSTHDTKRSEDVRARLDVLSEHPKQWAARLAKWAAINAPLRVEVDGKPAPDANEEVLLYQTLLGAWPFDDGELDDFRARLRDYLVKAAREAREFTSWRAPDPAWEEALCAFAEGLLDAKHGFRAAFAPMQATIARQGAQVALAQQLVKLTAPGVPDVYQGTELWDLSLVDPDNRRPVDHARRVELLAALDAEPPAEAARAALAGWRDGRLKLLVTRAALCHRRAHPALYARGDYLPLYADGDRRRHVVAYARRAGERWVVVVAPRLTAALAGEGWAVGAQVWDGAALALPAGAPMAWRDVITDARVEAPGGRLPVAAALGALPVALLEGIGEGSGR